MQTSEVLHTAADLIEKRGWVVGKWGLDSESAPMCLEGAIGAAAGVKLGGADLIRQCVPARAVADYLGASTTSGYRLYNWNDETGAFSTYGELPKRTAAEVIEVLRAAALVEEAREAELAAAR